MASKSDTYTFNVKSNIGATTKDASALASEFKVMGVSLNSLKSGLKSVASTAKASFSTWKKAAMSTGIGALVLAVGALVVNFTNTKKGAELLERAFAGLGATISVLTDRVSQIGGGIIKLFSKDTKGGLSDIKNAFKGIGTEIANDTRLAIELKKSFQDLRDSERDLNVETAQRRSQIEQLKLIAEDVTKSEEERLAAARKAFKIENDLLDKRLANAEEAVRIQKEQNEVNQSMDADLDALAEKEINLANIKAESTTKQIELNNKINSIEKEIEARRAAVREESMVEIPEMDNLFEQSINKKIKLIGKLSKAEEISFEKTKIIDSTLRELSEERVEWDAMTQNERLNLTKNTLNDLTKIAGEETEAGKALAITATTIDTFQSAQASYKSLAGIPVIGPALGGIAAAAAVAMGLKNIAAIRGANASGGGGGGSRASVGGLSATASSGTPSPQMISGEVDLTGLSAPEPVRAYVMTDEMTNSQEQLASIRRRATI
jgi:hypothetical protein